MKIGISVAAFETRFGPIVYSASNLEELNLIFRKISNYGYNGVDLFINKKSTDELKKIEFLLEKNHLEVSMLTCICLAEMGVNFSSADLETREKSLESYIGEIQKAKIVGAKAMPIGFIRGKKSDNESMKENLDRLADSTKILAKVAKENGINLCIEPINRYEANTLLSLEETVSFIDKYGLEDIYILADLFHMNIEDKNIEKSLGFAGDKIKHMHVADSNRMAPGMGHIDYKAVIDTLTKSGYSGYLSIEALPFGDSDNCANQGLKYLKKIISGIK